MSTRYAAAGERPLAPEREPNDRSILIGIVGTLLVHVLLVVLSPHFGFSEFSGVHTGIAVNSKEGQTFDFELTPMTEQEKERDPTRFVETNPDAPENEPDQTANFSNRNQQSAQAEAAKELDPERRPSITNAQDEIKNDMSIVSGDLSQPQAGARPLPEVANPQDAEQQQQRARAEQVPLSGFDKTEGDDPDGVATNLADAQSPTNNASQNVQGVRDADDPDGALAAIEAARRAQPKARQRLTAPRTTILTNRPTGVRDIGILGIDARWSEYGEYMAELVEIIQMSWYQILHESRVSPPRGSHVVVTFKLNAKGETDIVKVEDSGSGKQAVFSCQHAIQARQPYRPWTQQMIAVLGEEQTLTFSFHHQ